LDCELELLQPWSREGALVLKYKIQILRSAGHTVRATRNGDEAAKHYDERHYDLVLTDLWHPGLEGHKLIKRIFEKNPRQAVGVVSSTTVMEEKIRVPILSSTRRIFITDLTATPGDVLSTLG
jgi:CheY-like chemotaxis protein